MVFFLFFCLLYIFGASFWFMRLYQPLFLLICKYDYLDEINIVAEICYLPV